jgi:hypothetical protein
MHVAQVAPLAEPVPPKLYGGKERVVSWLTEELIAPGHEVTLFASGSDLLKRLISTNGAMFPAPSARIAREALGKCSWPGLRPQDEPPEAVLLRTNY